MNFKIEFPKKFEVDIYINGVLYSHQICKSFDGKYYLFCRPNNDIIYYI